MGRRLSDIMFRAVRWLILHLSDRSLARICRLAARLVYAFTGDEFLRGVLGEVVDIFQSGAPGTELIRKMFREVHGPYAADMLQGFLGL